MTQMLYRPQTKEIRFNGIELNKLVFCELPLDAIVVDEDNTDVYLAKGWFAHPDDMKTSSESKNDDRKPNNRRKSKAS